MTREEETGACTHLADASGMSRRALEHRLDLDGAHGLPARQMREILEGLLRPVCCCCLVCTWVGAR